MNIYIYGIIITIEMFAIHTKYLICLKETLIICKTLNKMLAKLHIFLSLNQPTNLNYESKFFKCKIDERSAKYIKIEKVY